jgi:hypothetical protein
VEKVARTVTTRNSHKILVEVIEGEETVLEKYALKEMVCGWIQLTRVRVRWKMFGNETSASIKG